MNRLLVAMATGHYNNTCANWVAVVWIMGFVPLSLTKQELLALQCRTVIIFLSAVLAAADPQGRKNIAALLLLMPYHIAGG